MERIYYSIGETAEILGESVSLVRYWANSFPRFVKPDKNAKGNRLFHPEDVEALKQIQHLVKDKGLKLKGAAQEMEASRAKVEKDVRVLETLKSIRARLVEVKQGL